MIKNNLYVTVSATDSPHSLRLQRVVALSGIILVLAGLFFTDAIKTLPLTVSIHNAILLALVLAASALLSVITRLRFVDAIAVTTFLLVLRFVGPAAVLAALLVLAASIVIGRRLSQGLGKLGHATSAVCGITVLTGLTGWLLPFQLHTFVIYLSVLGGIAIVGRRSLMHTLRCTRHEWYQATRAAPISATFAMSMLTISAFALLPPSVQYDDLAYHMLLPGQLAALGHYRMDIASQAWAVAPWASDLVQGYIAILSGHEARGAGNALWLVLTLGMLWNLGAEVGLKASLRWVSIALYATQPIVSALNGSMQADTAITTATLTLVTLTARMIRTRRNETLTAFMVVSGLLMALKTTQALLIAPMALIVLWHLGFAKFLKLSLARLPIALGICGSSYAYAWYFTGNPIFPLYNKVFQSPYEPATNFDDARWHHGLTWDSLWQVTFHTGNYQEAYAGAFGFALLALIGCVLLGLRLQKTRWLIIGLLFSLVSTFAAIQYTRYLVPLLAPLLTLALVAWQGVGLRRVGELLLAGIAMLNATFIPAAGYPLMDDINWTMFSKLNQMPVAAKASIDRRYAVESLVARHMALVWPHGYSIYLADPKRPFTAPFLGQAIGRSWYDPGMLEAAQKADQDLTGNAWLGLFERTGMTHVLTIGPVHGALAASLQRADATIELTIDRATVWRLCKTNCAELSHPLLEQRDLSKRTFR